MRTRLRSKHVWTRPSFLRCQRDQLVFSIPPHRPTPNFPPSWNVAPTDSLPVVRCDTKAGRQAGQAASHNQHRGMETPAERANARSGRRVQSGAVATSPNNIQELRFALDSPLEGAGFEPLVPRKRDVNFRDSLVRNNLPSSARGTKGSNPLPSTRESPFEPR
jgi:hypothetical protein